MNRFTLFDINNLKRSYDNATTGFDCLVHFLNTYDWDDIYETNDNSMVFDAGGADGIEIEFFNFNHPLKRTASILYRENGKPKLIYL